ncbi:MAG: substrate-binding domain-containing protein [Duncaniella sp.]|uniref:PstS family phosphate ABC transporter substrate-binding protein n=1 Tax=Duncaniella sp. TaxID=2518496 RepID=UPI0019C59193|nr:substrate-binding domain-containing protein [Duncaniella sp.]MBD5314134.1 phosphate ABC transporter substrate-binding protein [Bacteroides sp.]MDE6091134.1 substrate-binding domain-containing protein [Duncaniella sp.]
MTTAFKSIAAVTAFALLALLSGCGKKSSSQQPTPLAKVACDESFESIMEQEINVFEYIYPKEDVVAYYLPENDCIDSIMAMGGVKSAVITRPLTEKEVNYLRSNKKLVHQQRIAVDALAIIVNPENPVEILSCKDLAEILSGDVTRWDQVEPSKLGEISVIFDHQGSSTVKYMRDSILDGRPFGPNVSAVKTNPEVFKAVAENKNAMGIIGVSWVSSDMKGREQSVEELAQAVEKSDTTMLDFKDDVKVLKIRGKDVVQAYKPYQAYIFDGSYPLFRSVYMVTTAPGGTTTHRFYSFVTGFQGQKLIQMTGILPATLRPRMVQVE